MGSKTLDDDVEHIFREENPQAEAVKSLLNVKSRQKGQDSEIELKTDLDKNALCIHTAADLLAQVLDMDAKTFNSRCILGDLVNIKERKLLSKDRKSRQEIVEISKQQSFEEEQAKRSERFVKKLFMPQNRS